MTDAPIRGYLPIAALLCTAWLHVLGSPATSQQPFTEEAHLRGINYTSQYGLALGFGVVLVDLDQDSDPDVVALGRSDGVVGIFENNGHGFFADRSETSGIPALTNASAAIAGDYDGDGDLDIYFSNFESANVLARNDGGLQFSDVTTAAGVGDPGPGMGCAWADFDNDGLLDLYLANYDFEPNPLYSNRLYRNRGDSTFVDVAPSLGVESPELTFQPIFFDYDRDGDADLYLSTDKGYSGFGKNYLFKNTGGAFVDVSAASGAGIAIDSMGVAVGDFNGDLLQDLYCTNTPPGNPLLINDGSGHFSDMSASAGVQSFAIGWGALFFDYDNDGLMDLYVCNAGDPNRLFVCGAGWPCSDLAPDLGVATPGNSFGLAAGDIDLDGDVDLLVQNNGEPLRLYINHEGQRRNWVRFNVVGSMNDAFSIGASVEILTSELAQIQEVRAGVSYKSQNELTLHFGVNDAELIDQIAITQPGGEVRILTNLPVNETWTLYPQSMLGDADLDGVVGLNDFLRFESCYRSNGGEPFRPGCEMMDIDSDSDVDSDDFDLFLSRYEDPLSDCDESGVMDLLEIMDGSAPDDDHNGVLDACDLDGDGAADDVDNCVSDANGDQADRDGDGVGDICDNCPDGANLDQTDTDSDGVGDFCDPCPFDESDDSDGDGTCNSEDPCPADNPDDSDGDGVCDGEDECPDDPDKTVVGNCGCGTADDDSDDDGRLDCVDECPDDPDKIAPGDCGCGTADDDSDDDGRLDCVDECPDDPDKIAPGDCGCGTADDDSDDDGRLDCTDECPDDPDKIAPGVCGCGESDADSDSDGVPDCQDDCSADPNKTNTGICGCGTADVDEDQNGVPECSVEDTVEVDLDASEENVPECNDCDEAEPGSEHANVSEDNDRESDSTLQPAVGPDPMEEVMEGCPGDGCAPMMGMVSFILVGLTMMKIRRRSTR